MKLPMLTVDKNIEVFERERKEWLKHGISTVRVDSMQEAIEKLSKEPFLFTAINADNINYKPLLKAMRDTVPTFIFIIISAFTHKDEIEALRNGADVYTQFADNPEETVQLGLAQLLRCSERDKRPKLPKGMIIYDRFLVSTVTRSIYCNDARMKLTKLEYELLYYFIINHDTTLTYKQILRKIWGEGYDDTEHQLLWNHVRALRKKISKALGNAEYIENEKNNGYRFSAPISP